MTTGQISSLKRLVRQILPKGLRRGLKRRFRIVQRHIYQIRWSIYREIYYRARQRKVTQTVIYEAFGGNGTLDHPEAIFRYLIKAPDMQHLKHVWVLKRRSKKYPLLEEFARDGRVRAVKRFSVRYFLELGRAKYVMSNQGWAADFVKRPEQIYVNTWHGTPLKRMGYHRPGGAYELKNIIRNFLQADYLVSYNRYTTDVMYRDAYKLDGIYPGTVLEIGSPRMDQQFMTDAQAQAVRQKLQQGGLEIDPDKKILLYAPTWKGQQFLKATVDTDELLELCQTIAAGLRGTDWQLVVKVHQALYSVAVKDRRLRGILVPNDVPTNLILGVTDALIGDYSSIFFDFLPLKRPIYFYVPDRDIYEQDLGLYLAEEELPGHCFTEISDVIEQIVEDAGEITDAHVRAKHESACERFSSLEDGQATKRLVDIAMRGLPAGDCAIDIGSTPKTRLLFNIGGFFNNGITVSGLNILKALDPDKYDVTLIIWPGNKRSAVEEKLHTLPYHIRTIIYSGVPRRAAAGSWWQRKLLEINMSSTNSVRFRRSMASMMEQDRMRTFGNTKFDCTIDYSGYGLFANLSLLSAHAPRHLVWQHNDMAAEWAVFQETKQASKRQIQAVFSLYREHDAIVSVSEALAEVNRKSCSVFADAKKFTHLENLSDIDRILELATEELPQPLEEDLVDPQPWVGEYFEFLHIGRYSTEKNHERLIRAFALVHAKFPEARLTLLGSGPLFEQTQELAAQLGLQEVVSFQGQVPNPYPYIKRARCLVIASDHEGQPMVILEARALNTPVVSTRFPSVSGALPQGVGVITDLTPQALAEGMNAAITDVVPMGNFDATAYNNDILRRFEQLVRGPAAHTVA